MANNFAYSLGLRDCLSKTAFILEGWLFDLYPSSQDGMVVWLITREGKPIRLCDPWHPTIYAWAKNAEHLPFIQYPDFSNVEVTLDHKYIRPGDFERSKVLRLTFQRSSDISSFLREIDPTRLTDAQLFNVDVPTPQLYLYEKNLFPLALVRAQVESDGIVWNLLDDADSCQYETPPLKGASIALRVKESEKVPAFSDPIESITVTASRTVTKIDYGSEVDKLLDLVRLVEEIDPDVILTKNGDSFILPYLVQRALQNNVLAELVLDREGRHLRPPKKDGKSYFSYGRIYYKPTPTRLLGRLHLDEYNDFIFEDCGLHGLFEIARTCRTPLHRASRETIGTNMTSLQMYQAFRRDILIPWKKNEPENFKSAWELLKADRGGFVLEPKIGLFDHVGEIDFASLYPTLMMKYNLTPECISCRCCAHTRTHTQVPELHYNLCERNIGVVPHTLRILLDKRARYKALISKTSDSKLRAVYDQRQAALKWSLVTSFGYLGYRNARFGKIDAHIGVCAFARQVLHDTVKIAQQRGFSVVHGIVDSAWLRKEDADEKDYVELCETIERKLGLPISFEGIYRWIVFLPSKVYAELPVLNRYYGVFERGGIKVRGVEYRRRDAPAFIKNCQLDVINYLAAAQNRAEFFRLLPGALHLVRNYVRELRCGEVNIEDLLITKQLSKNPSEYKNKVVQAVAAKQLIREGRQVSAGQTVSYLLQRGMRSESSVLAEELIDGPVHYDVERYIDFVLDAVAGLLGPVGYDKERLRLALQEKLN
jgi:DNA polymerase elongation subunit (family B)